VYPLYMRNQVLRVVMSKIMSSPCPAPKEFGALLATLRITCLDKRVNLL
jgi:hypothetical protein